MKSEIDSIESKWHNFSLLRKSTRRDTNPYLLASRQDPTFTLTPKDPVASQPGQVVNSSFLCALWCCEQGYNNVNYALCFETLSPSHWSSVVSSQRPHACASVSPAWVTLKLYTSKKASECICWCRVKEVTSVTRKSSIPKGLRETLLLIMITLTVVLKIELVKHSIKKAFLGWRPLRYVAVVWI